jgi:hypothetical protein
MTDKIRATHIERKAVVYLRQSSLQQVREHRESTRRQYALRERAIALGWSADAVEVIDEDLGQLSEDDRRQVLALALLRMLIRDVTLSPIDLPERATRIQVLWVTGATSEMHVPRPAKEDATRTSEEALAALRELFEQMTSSTPTTGSASTGTPSSATLRIVGKAPPSVTHSARSGLSATLVADVPRVEVAGPGLGLLLGDRCRIMDEAGQEAGLVVPRCPQGERQVVVRAEALGDLAQLVDRHAEGVLDVDAVTGHAPGRARSPCRAAR